MYFCSMTFVFPYKKRTSDFELIQSIRWIRMSFPLAKIFTIGDEIDGVQNIPCKVFSNIRGVDVTNKILTFANEIGGKFIYMNDDFFVTPKLRADVPIYNGELIINPKHPGHYQIACKNSIEFWKDEPILFCPGCKKEVRNPRLDLACAEWCKFADECLGILPEE